MGKRNWVRIFTLLTTAILSLNVQAALVGEWGFNGNLNDSLGGPNAQVSNVGDLEATGFAFGNYDYVTLPLATLTAADTYSIRIRFSLDSNTRSYQRILSFDGVTSDKGLYTTTNYFYFYNTGPKTDNYTFTPNELMDLVVSRNGVTDVFSAQLNGNHLWSFEDTEKHAVLTASNQNLIFFRDDRNENGTGFLDHIEIYDSVIVPTSYMPSNSANTTPVPIPATAWLLGSGLLGIVGFRKRRSATKA